MENAPKGLELAVIGNCAYNALIDQRGSLVWTCLPRFDGDPVFCSLLRKNQDIGFFDIEVHKSETIQQSYVENTAILQTLITDSQGGCVEIMDFAPRFKKVRQSDSLFSCSSSLIPLTLPLNLPLPLFSLSSKGFTDPI
jgi:GH15 family glucan-1,4-alpha-glucosidase